MKISLIIPVFNAESFIEGNVENAYVFLQQRLPEFELLVVDDGSADNTFGKLTELKEKGSFPRLNPIKLDVNAGKFGAIKRGVEAATGECIIFTDADLPFEMEALAYIESLVNSRGFHIVIGDRSLAESIYSSELSPIRQLSTFIFSCLVRMFVAGGLFDTQCGLKGFRSDVAKAIFPLLTNNGFAGDVELLYIALKYNLEIKRIPVRLKNSGASTVRVFSHGLNMIKNISNLRLNWMKGVYSSPGLKIISQQQYWKQSDTL